MWNVAEAWEKWRASRGRGTPSGAVSMQQRAQVAAILGNDVSKDVRQRLSCRAGQLKRGQMLQTSTFVPGQGQVI